MARLHEYQGKALLAQHGIEVPRFGVACSADEAATIAEGLGGPVVVKIQAWTTGRKAIGGVSMVNTPEQARVEAARMLEMKISNFPVTEVLVEELISIDRELFVSLSIDDAARAPMILLSLEGGSGIEDRGDQVAKLPVSLTDGVDETALDEAIARGRFAPAVAKGIADAVKAVVVTARAVEARSVEINPLVVTTDNRIMAADCRMTIDDYAVFRHPELGIEIARELDHPPTELERVAYEVEQADHRGTFYFAKLNTVADAGSKGLIGFHGAGGGGSMMSMDAITNAGFTIANFTDTSGNPSASKVYRAARIILSQPGLVGYFGSGSGVASQEQFWSAYGLAKAFWEVDLAIPAVIRLGGNSEDRAVDILRGSCQGLAATVEGFRKDDTPQMIAERFGALVSKSNGLNHDTRAHRVPSFVGSADAFSFNITGGRVWIDTARWAQHASLAIEHSHGILQDDDGKPALAISPEEVAGKDSELIACEVECRTASADIVFVELEIPGLEEAVG